MLTQREWQETTHPCLECGGEMIEITGTLTHHLGDYTITVEGVPMKECPDCGERYVPGPVAEDVSDIVESAKRMILENERQHDDQHSRIGGMSVQYTDDPREREMVLA